MLHAQATERVSVNQFLAALGPELELCPAARHQQQPGQSVPRGASVTGSYSVSNAPNGMAATNYYDDLFSRLIGDGVPLPAVIERVAGAYLDGKPLLLGKKKLTKKERDILFWASDVVKGCPPDA